MNRREFFKLAAVSAATVVLPGRRMIRAASAPKKQTNILLIMIDDLGWMDLHC